MAIKIYTYNNPCRLNREPYWKQIKDCPFFCSSQTMVNGLKAIYKNEERDSFVSGKITTITQLVNSLYEYWQSTSCMIKQNAKIDGIINSNKDQEEYRKFYDGFVFNREDVYKSLRIMFELNMCPEHIDASKLSEEENEIYKIFCQIYSSSAAKDFIINDNFSSSQIDSLIQKALINDQNDVKVQYNSLSQNRIVILGIHQFSPMILRTIETIAKYKDVVLLFNYMPKYANAYQTWIDVYDQFEPRINMSENEIANPPLKTKTNILGDNIGKLINGENNTLDFRPNVEVIEFNNITEFAEYVAKLYNEAKSKANGYNPLSVMNEQFYGANSDVNKILKIYFPEQFEERDFLNYPLGHFFIAISNMWNVNEQCLYVDDFDDIRECLSAHILTENEQGELLSIFNQTESLFLGLHSLKKMIKKLEKVKHNQQRFNDHKKEISTHLSYYNVSAKDIELLIQAFKDLESISKYFFEDFEQQQHNFKKFYDKLQDYLKNKIPFDASLNTEFNDIIRRVLMRLDEVANVDVTASFECLRSTMSIYLKQETNPVKKANWIVRNFDQIDGDALRSKKSQTYHYACLSDEDIMAVNHRTFPWPLTDSFFEIAQNPVDWKYQVYVTSSKEYRNFKRYAFLYGLLYTKSDVKLSYVKNNRDSENHLYYLLDILDAKVIPYSEFKLSENAETYNYKITSNKEKSFDIFDLNRYQLCPYRFLLESLVEGTTIYKDEFLMEKYFEIIIENTVLNECSQSVPEELLNDKINNCYAQLRNMFPFIQNVNRVDILFRVKKHLNKFYYLRKRNKQVNHLSNRFKELFLVPAGKSKGTINYVTDLDDININVLKNASLNKYSKSKNLLYCKYCANKDICLKRIKK